MGRSGGFTGTLDPFGGSRGGLGRYTISGDTIQSLAEYEAYAVAVAWANGTATDDEYKASLQKLLDLATPGTKEHVTAQNRLEDAVYQIGRNEMVRDVNNSTSQTARVAALTALQAYDRTRLNAMTATDSEAYREQQDRVAGAGVDIRQAKYADMVEKVNRGKATVEQLLALATTFRQQAAGQPDRDEWTTTVASLHERVADDKLAEGFQAYQHNRKSGASLLADIDRRLGQLTPGSPAYKDLQRQREDLAERVRGERNAVQEATFQGQRSSGKITDAETLAYLKREYEEAPPGTTEAINAGNRLKDFTFSLAEDKLRYDVSKGKRQVGDLIRFYKTYQRAMSPGSERWRQLQGAIDTLTRRGGASGGGGGGGSGGRSSGSGLSLGPKIIGGEAVLADFLGNGKVKAPPGFADLLRIDVNNPTSRKWFDNNLRSMVDAFQDGEGTWTYYDQRGNGYSMPFVPSLMGEMDALNVGYMHQGLALADNAKDAQAWVGRLITATNTGQARGATYTMDVYTKTFADIQRLKQAALAGGRYGEYSNLVRQQYELARLVLGTPDGQPPDLGNTTNPYLTDSQKAGIMADLAKLAPRNMDDANPDVYNPEGDPVLGLIASGAITTQTDPITGDILAAQLDPNRGYVTQLEDGSIGLVEINVDIDPTQFRTDELTGGTVPRYRDERINVTIRVDGQDVAVWQPVVTPAMQTGVASGALVYQITPPQPGGHHAGSMGPSTRVPPGRYGSAAPLIGADGRLADLALFQTYTLERGKTVRWLSTDQVTWVRWGAGEDVSPRIVLPPDVRVNSDGAFTQGGKTLLADEVAALAHVWGAEDAVAAGAPDNPEWGVGAPGASFQVRKPQGQAGPNGSWVSTGTFDFRSDYIIDSEERAALFRTERQRGQREQEPEFDVRPMGYGVADPGMNRDQASRDKDSIGATASDFLYRTGALLDKVAKAVIAPPSKPKQLSPLARGIDDSALRDWGVKPTPSATLKPPPVATLGPAQQHVAPGSTAALKPGAKPYLPPIRKPPPPKPKPAPKPPPQGAPGAYRPPAPKAKPVPGLRPS